jgi:hypothetical protein
VAGSCEYGDEPSGSGATELVISTGVTQLYLAFEARESGEFPGLRSTVLHKVCVYGGGGGGFHSFRMNALGF